MKESVIPQNHISQEDDVCSRKREGQHITNQIPTCKHKILMPNAYVELFEETVDNDIKGHEAIKTFD